MQRRLAVFLLPSLATDDDLAGRTAVVVDVLRATTTIAHALAAGAVRVIPCLETAQAQQRAAESPDVLLGGERGGVRIEGFDLGNSPQEYNRQAVSDRTIVFTTTNGTKAMERCRGAKRVLLGAFVHFSDLCDRLSSAKEVAIVCAGTQGEITREDVLLAGAVIDDLSRRSTVQLNDQAELAADAWRSLAAGMANLQPLAEVLRSSRGGRNMIEIGQERDIEIAAQLDKFNLTPELNLDRWEITAATS